jgi:hypothetical protein
LFSERLKTSKLRTYVGSILFTVVCLTDVSQDPETVRVRVKFLTEIKPRTVDATAETLPLYSARRPSLDGLWCEAPQESKDSKWPDVQSKVAALPFPAHIQRRSRAMSLYEAEAEPEVGPLVYYLELLLSHRGPFAIRRHLIPISSPKSEFLGLGPFS